MYFIRHNAAEYTRCERLIVIRYELLYNAIYIKVFFQNSRDVSINLCCLRIRIFFWSAKQISDSRPAENITTF